MKKFNVLKAFTPFEYMLWTVSVFFVVLSFCVFDGRKYLTLAASVVGVTSLIFNAKGHPAGQIMMIVFSLLYGIISYSFAYYGEMITYLFMTMPMAFFAFVSWAKNPYKKGSTQVKVAEASKKEIMFMCVLAALVTLVFYFILKFFNTANLFWSTVSVTTSFAAVYLSFLRSPYYAVAYALNDIVLIILWSLASFADLSFVSVTVCFAAFLANDIYGFIAWRKMKKEQSP